MLRTGVVLFLALLLLALPHPGRVMAQASATAPAAPATPPAKDQSQLGTEDESGTDATDAPAVPDDAQGTGAEDQPDAPAVPMIDLTPDIARRAIDAYAVITEKYKDDNLEDYESLDDFVAKAPRGRELEADIAAKGFASVTEWNAAITTVGVAYSALSNHQTEDVQSQIDDIQKDESLDPAMKERMVASLKAMIPSPANKQVIEDMMKDAGYAAKLKLLDQEE